MPILSSIQHTLGVVEVEELEFAVLLQWSREIPELAIYQCDDRALE